jgi:hypothetical protein
MRRFFPACSDDPAVAAWVACAVWASLSPYAHQEIAHWTADEIIRRARLEFGEDAADARIMVH